MQKDQELDSFYDASTALLQDKQEENYLKLLELASVQKLKFYLCKIIPQEFKYFPQAQEKALNTQWDLCEDDDISVRKEAIKHLPIMANSFASRIADVLWQFMQSEYDDELAVVKASLKRVLEEYTLETVDAFFHQILHNPDVRDRAIDFLILNFPKEAIGQVSSGIIDKFLKSMDTIEYSAEQNLKLFKFITNTFSESLNLQVKEKMVEKITTNSHSTSDSKEILQRANSCLGFFKEGVSSTGFLEWLNGIWNSASLKDVNEATLYHLHILMLFADLIGYQKMEGKYIELFPELIMNFYSTGLGNLLDKTGFLMAEPIVYCIYKVVCGCPSRYSMNEEFYMALRQIFSSSQVIRDEISRKIRELENIALKSAAELNNLKKLKKQYRAAQNILNMSREILKPESARKRLIITVSWKPEPIERSRAPSDTTLVSSSSVSKRKESITIAPQKKKAKTFATEKKVKQLPKKQPIEKKSTTPSKKQEKIFFKAHNRNKSKEENKPAPLKNQLKYQAPKSKNSNLSIAGTASRSSLSTVMNSPRHISLLRPVPKSASGSIFQGAIGAAMNNVSNAQPVKRVVTFGPQTNFT